MNESHDLDPVQKLLALKRYEQPPPGYFSTFSIRVIAQIEALELEGQTPWWHRWINGFQARPILICAYGLVVCGSLLVGLGLVDMGDGGSVSLPITDEALLLTTPALATSVRTSQSHGLTLADPVEVDTFADFHSPVKSFGSRFAFERALPVSDFQKMHFNAEAR